MKKFFLILGLLVGNVAIAGEPSDLSDLGLDSLVTVSEDVGNEVRGLSASASSTGLSAIAGIIFDPTSSSQFNFNTNNFATSSDENAGASEVATSGVETAAGFTAFTLDIGAFQADFSGGLVVGTGQGAGASPFAIPAFTVTP